MKILLSTLILGFGLLAGSAQASPRSGTFDDPDATVPKRHHRVAPSRHAAPFRYEIAPPSDDVYQSLHDRAP